MANDFFRFKQFTVFQDRCAMKVGTDGVLLGAWTPVYRVKRALDIGCGTGLISLMLAQRCDAEIIGVEVNEEAARQAEENILLSPWGHRIQIEYCDIRNFGLTEQRLFDLIVSNPPYHQATVLSPDAVRSQARSTSSLSFSDLLSSVNLLLADEGHFAVILPVEATTDFISLAYTYHLYLIRRTNVISRIGKPIKRVLLMFSRVFQETLIDEFAIETAPQVKSPEFLAMTADFYI